MVYCKHWKKNEYFIKTLFFSCFSYLPWFEVYYKLLNTLADYLAKEQVILHILVLCEKFPWDISHHFKYYKGILYCLKV